MTASRLSLLLRQPGGMTVAEASAGIIYTELTKDKDLYISITLPSLIVRLEISIALSETYTCGTAKIGTRDEVSKFIILLLHGAGIYSYRNRSMRSVR